MSEYLKIEENKVYFLTLTIVDWVDIFTRDCYVNILVDSIKYCQANKGLEIYTYVIMPSHLHMIASTEGSLSNILRDLKEHVSKEIIKEIKANPRESRKEWLIERFQLKTNSEKPNYRVWQEGNYPVELYSFKFIDQKENYILMNPVNAGYVAKPEDYRLSSASEDSPIKVLPIK